MPARAGQIVVEMTAGSRTFIQDVEVAKTKIRELGATGQSANAGMVSATKATTASIKAMEGGFANNNKAAAAFLNTVLGGGKIMQAAFPIVGGLAFAGMLDTIGTKVQDFFKNLEEAPARTAAAFRGIYEPLQKENDELQVTNDKLAMEIGKLSGLPGTSCITRCIRLWIARRISLRSWLPGRRRTSARRSRTSAKGWSKTVSSRRCPKGWENSDRCWGSRLRRVSRTSRRRIRVM